MADQEFSIEELMYAFTLEATARITAADGVVDTSEMDYIRKHFPASQTATYEFFDGTEPNERFKRALGRARGELSGRLSDQQKLSVAEILTRSCLADGSVDPRESDVVREAMAALGMGESEYLPEVLEVLGEDKTARSPRQ